VALAALDMLALMQPEKLRRPIDRWQIDVWSRIFDTDKWPSYVHYRGTGKPDYCPPHVFGFLQKRGLTDCDWIVPGILER
jgi:hypothetical protein